MITPNQHPGFPAVDNSRQMGELTIAIRTARLVAEAARTRRESVPPDGPNRYQDAILGLLDLAIGQSEAVEWAMTVGNPPAAMASMRVLLEMWLNLNHVSSEPAFRDRRACQLLLEGPLRNLKHAANQPPTQLPPAMIAAAVALMEGERDELLTAIATLPGGKDDGERWTTRKKEPPGLSTGQRARLHGFDLHYDFLYDVGSAFIHGDGFAISHARYFTPADVQNIPDQVGLMLMTFASDVLDEIAGLDHGEIAEAWNAYVASQKSHP